MHLYVNTACTTAPRNFSEKRECTCDEFLVLLAMPHQASNLNPLRSLQPSRPNKSPSATHSRPHRITQYDSCSTNLLGKFADTEKLAFARSTSRPSLLAFHYLALGVGLTFQYDNPMEPCLIYQYIPRRARKIRCMNLPLHTYHKASLGKNRENRQGKLRYFKVYRSIPIHTKPLN